MEISIGAAFLFGTRGNAMTKTIFADIPDTIRETVLAEIEAHNFSAVEIRWLIALLTNDPLIPAPTAAAMVARVAGQPLGSTLLTIEESLMMLPEPSPQLMPAERKMTAVILQALIDRLTKTLVQLNSGGANS